jgi:hypothetical protein
VDRSLELTLHNRDRIGIPASPYRRLDAGAIGSLAATYPLALWSADDPRIVDTIQFIREKCFVRGGFFQDMIHSGINPYLTLHVAQALLRADDDVAFFQMLDAVADLASPTGQWPEAIHPQTLGGCMGDGQHMWAAAEWLLAMRNAFVREEAGMLILGSGIPRIWLKRRDGVLELDGAPTPHGDVSIRLELGGDDIRLRCRGRWRTEPPKIEVRLPEFKPVLLTPSSNELILERAAIQ